MALFKLLAVLVVAAAGAKRTTVVLSEDPRVEYREQFMPPEDASALVRVAKALMFDFVQNKPDVVTGGDEVCYLNETESLGDERPEDWLAVHRFEKQVSEWTGVNSSAVPVVARWDTWSAKSHMNRTGAVHMDSRWRARHRHTVLAYLSGNGMDGGATVFPCVETDDMPVAEVKRRFKMCSRAMRHVRLAHEKLLQVHAEGLSLPPSKQLAFLEANPELAILKSKEGSFTPNWIWTPEMDANSQTKAAGVTRVDSLYELADAMCRGEAPGLRVLPKVGAAVLFEAATPTRKGQLEPDWHLWHAGCAPMKGHGKRYTAQLFIDHPAPSSETCSAGAASCAKL